jgi:hypothetical protein
VIVIFAYTGGFFGMNFYQVNQNTTFERELRGGYLCCPNDRWGGWPLMKQLRRGDILFHYNSTHRAILGISKVIDIGQHKGTASNAVHIIPGTQCIQYTGKHLSENDLGLKQKEHNKYKGYTSYLEVHTIPILKKNLGKLLSQTPQVYLVKIKDEEARCFFKEWGIALDDLK